MNDTKYLSDKVVYQAKYFRVKKMELERNGKKFTKEYIERAPSVFIIPYTSSNEIYLEYQYREYLENGCMKQLQGLWKSREIR